MSSDTDFDFPEEEGEGFDPFQALMGGLDPSSMGPDEFLNSLLGAVLGLADQPFTKDDVLNVSIEIMKSSLEELGLRPPGEEAGEDANGEELLDTEFGQTHEQVLRLEASAHDILKAWLDVNRPDNARSGENGKSGYPIYEVFGGQIAKYNVSLCDILNIVGAAELATQQPILGAVGMSSIIHDVGHMAFLLGIAWATEVQLSTEGGIEVYIKEEVGDDSPF